MPTITDSPVPHVIFRKAKRVYIRPILPEDIPWFVVWINDGEVTQYLRTSFPFTPGEEYKWYEDMQKEKGKQAIFAIVLAETHTLIGVMGLESLDHISGTAVTGSYIGSKEHWGKGYGTEAKMLVLEYAFNTLNLRKICAVVYDFNPRSKRCLEKCGYKEEGRRKAQHYRNGRYADDYLMAVFKDDFLPLWKVFEKEVLVKE